MILIGLLGSFLWASLLVVLLARAIFDAASSEIVSLAERIRTSPPTRRERIAKHLVEQVEISGSSSWPPSDPIVEVYWSSVAQKHVLTTRRRPRFVHPWKIERELLFSLQDLDDSELGDVCVGPG